MNAKRILRNGHQALLQAVAGLPEADWYTPGASGKRSVKDLIAFQSSLEQVLVEAIGSLVDGRATPTAERLGADPLAFDDAEVAGSRGRSARQVWESYEMRHLESLQLVSRLEQAYLNDIYSQPGRLPWYDRQASLEDFIVYTFYGTKRETSALISAFRDQLSRQRAQRAERARAAWQAADQALRPALGAE